MRAAKLLAPVCPIFLTKAELADTVTLDAFLICNKEATSLLKVNEDSMIEYVLMYYG